MAHKQYEQWLRSSGVRVTRVGQRYQYYYDSFFTSGLNDAKIFAL